MVADDGVEVVGEVDVVGAAAGGEVELQAGTATRRVRTPSTSPPVARP